MIFPQIITPVSSQAEPEYSWLNLSAMDGILDPNNLLSTDVAYDSETNVNSIVVDMNATGAAVLDLDDALIFYKDISKLAQDDFGMRFDLQFDNDASLKSSNLACCLGLTSDLADLANYAFGAGANYQTSQIRGWRCRGNTRSVGGLGTNNEGVRAVCQRSGGSDVGAGNIAHNYQLQALDDSDWQGVGSYYGVSNGAMNAASPTDPLYLFFAVQIISASATTKQMDVKIKVSPFVTS